MNWEIHRADGKAMPYQRSIFRATFGARKYRARNIIAPFKRSLKFPRKQSILLYDATVKEDQRFTTQFTNANSKFTLCSFEIGFQLVYTILAKRCKIAE